MNDPFTPERIAQANARQDERIRRVRLANEDVFKKLVDLDFRVNRVLFNSRINNDVVGTIFLEDDVALRDISEDEKTIVKKTSIDVFRSLFPERKIDDVILLWDSYEMIVREFDGSYDKYMMSL